LFINRRRFTRHRDITAEEMTKLLADDPAAKSGLIAYDVKTWMVGVGTP